ncbi:MAG: amino acid ABC transporter permease, partial [Clostridia bacterium]
KYGDKFLYGAGMTLLIALTGTLAGFLIGLCIGVMRTMPVPRNATRFHRILRKLLNFCLSTYIEVFRSTPMMVQAMVIYYGLAQMFQIDMSQWTAGIVIVSINTGAYMAEIVRGGIDSVDRGQREAAHSIGMTHMQTMLYIILPQAVRNILPAMGNEFVVNIKDTSVLNVISVSELFFMSKSVAGTYYRFYEVFFITCVIYFVLTFTITRLLRLLERKLDGPGSYRIMGSQSAHDAEIHVKGAQRDV